MHFEKVVYEMATILYARQFDTLCVQEHTFGIEKLLFATTSSRTLAQALALSTWPVVLKILLDDVVVTVIFTF